MRIVVQLKQNTISSSIKTQITTTTTTKEKMVWVLNSVSAWLVNVYTKNEIGNIDRDFSIDFENIFLS